MHEDFPNKPTTCQNESNQTHQTPLRRAFFWGWAFNAMHFKAWQAQIASATLCQLSSPVCTGWPHPKVRGQPSPTKPRDDTGNCQRERDGVRGERSITKPPSSLSQSGNNSAGESSMCDMTLNSLVNAQRNSFSHFSQGSHKSAIKNWDRELVLRGREKQEEKKREGLFYYVLKDVVECWQCAYVWKHETGRSCDR